MIRPLRFWLRARKTRDRVFRCPVCHLELSMADLDKDGYTVCPVCSVVLEVVMSNGYPLPVVHDLEVKRIQPKFRVHSLSTHLSVGLLPVGLLFGLLGLFGLWGGCSRALDLERIGAVLFTLAFGGSFLTFGSGFLDWRRRYRARPYQQITLKIRLSILLFVLGTAALLIRIYGVEPGGLTTAPFYLFLGLQAAMLGIIGVVGHIGGNLVFGK